MCSYSQKIAFYFGNDKPAPNTVTCKDGTVLLNKWIVTEHRSTPILGETKPEYNYTVMNWVNELDEKPEYYHFYDSDYSSIFTKRSAKHDAMNKAEELRQRDNIPLAYVRGS